VAGLFERVHDRLGRVERDLVLAAAAKQHAHAQRRRRGRLHVLSFNRQNTVESGHLLRERI
jgi:hypothetical protein